MKKMSMLDRIMLLGTGLLAAYQVVAGGEAGSSLATLAYTVAFGVLLIAGLLLIIFGFEILANPLVAAIAAIIPLSLSLGLVIEYIPTLQIAYSIFTAIGLCAIAITRFAISPGPLANFTLAGAHGVAGVVIFGLPIVLSAMGATPIGFALVSIGGALIGVGGLLLTLLKAGKPILSAQTIFAVLPGLLLAMTAAFVVGLALG